MKQIWIELIAFDRSLEDCGVDAVLADMGVLPERVSLLLYSPEFVNGHTDDPDDLVPVECTSYGARPYSSRGARQDWRRGEVGRLVAALQARGLQVFFAVFDLYGFDLDGRRQHSASNIAHPELTVIDRQGERIDGLLDPLKRLADGTPYAEFFAERAAAVSEFYGFDGLHGADGFSSSRLSLWDADFSPETVAEFEQRSGMTVEGASTPERASWIWRSARREWIGFHADLWTEFWRTVCTRLHAIGRSVVLNNAWTRDPFEALLRYGVDYQRLVGAGVDGFVLETSSSAVELLEEPTLPPLHGQLATVLLTRAALPDTPLTGLIALHDTYEQWDVVNLAPAMLERDLRLLTAMRSRVGLSARTLPCLDSVLFCLADGVDPAAWARIDYILGTLDREPAGLGSSATVLYDPAVIPAELDTFSTSSTAHTHAVLASLLRAGAVVSTSAPFAQGGSVPGTVLVLRPELYPAQEIDRLFADCERVVTIGPVEDSGAMQDGSGWMLRLGGRTLPDQRWDYPAERVHGHPADRDDPDADLVASWLIELPMSAPAAELVRHAATLLRSEVGESGSGSGVQLVVGAVRDGASTVLFHNPDVVFRDASFRPRAELRHSARLSGPAALPSRVVDGAVTVRVPPKGVTAVRLSLEDEPDE